MPAVALTEMQKSVMCEVVHARPHAVVHSLAQALGYTPAVIQHTLDALTRRGFVTPIDEFVYVPTKLGKSKVYA